MPETIPTISKEKMDAEVLTRAKMKPIIDDLKEFITSTAHRTENVLGSKIDKLDERLTVVEVTVKRYSNAIMDLSRNMKGMEKRLDEKIDGVRTELKEEIKQTETRLANKIDKVGEKIENHETRITNLETARL